MTSQPGKETFVINILPNILRSKGNQTTKSGQLIEYNKLIFFLEKSYTKCGGETIHRPFLKKIKIEYISGTIVESFIQFVPIKCQVEGYRNTLKLSFRPLAFTSSKAFFKNKESPGTSFPASFWA